MKKSIIIILSVLIFSSCTKQLLIKNYPNGAPAYSMFGKTPERTFYYPVELTDSLELVWNESVKGSFSNNSVIIEGEYVFTSDLAANIYCFDADTGKTIGADKGKGEIAVTPILNNGTMYYIITKTDETYSLLVRYDIRKGERLKEVEIPGRVGNEMIKLENSFVIVTDDGKVFKYDIFLQKIWEVDLEEKVYTSPAGTKDAIYVVTYSGKLFSIDSEDGSENYQVQLDGNFESAITISNDLGIVGSDDGNIIAFNINDGSIVWQLQTDAKIKAAIVHDRELGYASNLAGSIFSFNLSDGALKWKYKSEGMFNTPGALFKNVFLQPDVDRKLLFINPLNGEVLKTIEYDARVKLNPVYFNGRLFVGVDRGELYCYKLVAK